MCSPDLSMTSRKSSNFGSPRPRRRRCLSALSRGACGSLGRNLLGDGDRNRNCFNGSFIVAERLRENPGGRRRILVRLPRLLSQNVPHRSAARSARRASSRRSTTYVSLSNQRLFPRHELPAALNALQPKRPTSAWVDRAARRLRSPLLRVRLLLLGLRVHSGIIALAVADDRCPATRRVRILRLSGRTRDSVEAVALRHQDRKSVV